MIVSVAASSKNPGVKRAPTDRGTHLENKDKIQKWGGRRQSAVL
jgi:hypothetical protein